MRRALLSISYLAALVGLFYLTARGWEYYRLPLVARLRHPLHWELKPGGSLGLLFGIAGASLMTLMLAYTLRKRVPILGSFGALGDWLDFHILCGVVGPLLIVLHSAFKVGGLIAIAFWSMVAVAGSGVFGRFLYAQIPRTARGDELSLDEARRLEQELTATLQRDFALSAAEIAALTGGDSERAERQRSLLGALFALLAAPFLFRRRFARFRRLHRAIPRHAAARLARLARQGELLHRRLALWRHLHELFHYWHVFHKPFAVLMYLFAAIHIGVAWATGYARGFS
jgi:hypothetical protein